MNNKPPSIIFMGTPEFSVPAMKAIHSKFGIKAVVTVPDKPQGRGNKIIPSPVKVSAMELGITVYQPESLKNSDFITEISKSEPDIIIVIAFRILPKELYSLSKVGTFNIHASLLPKFRGAAPINWAIINGEKKTGLTSFLLDMKVDTGRILIQKEIDINENMTAGELHDTMMSLAADLAVKTCELLLSGKFQTFEQDDSCVSPAPKIFPETCKLDWNINVDSVINLINGLSPTPGAWTTLDGLKFKIIKALKSEKIIGHPAEFEINKNNMIISCLNGSILPIEVQLQGKKLMDIQGFINGFRGERKGILN